MSTAEKIVRTVAEDRPVAVGDMISVKPFGGRVATRGRVFLVTEHVAYYLCAPRACPGCRPNRYDSQRQGSHRVWRSWLDWYREDAEEDREIREALAGGFWRVWDPATGRYADVVKEARNEG